MKKETAWREKYRGVIIEIKNWGLHGDSDAWAFYIYLFVEQFPKNMRKKLWRKYFYTPYGTPLQHTFNFSDLKWHCGQTYYSRESQPDHPFKIFCVGCDYNHYWDEGHIYDEHSILIDAKDCVDSLLEQFPELKTQEKCWEEHRAKFPNKGDICDKYDKHGNLLKRIEFLHKDGER